MSKKQMHETVGIDRRNFMKGIGGTAGVATAGIGGSYYASRNAAAIPPLLLAGAAGGVVAGAAIGYATRRVQEYMTGDDFDESAYDGLSAEETHALVREMAMNMSSSDDSALTNLNNVLDLSKNASYNDAQASAIETMDMGGSIEETKTSAIEAIDKFYTTQQKNILDHVAIQNGKMERLVSRVDAATDLTLVDVWKIYYTNGTTTTDHLPGFDNGTVGTEVSSSLLDGTDYSYHGYIRTTNQGDVFKHTIDEYITGDLATHGQIHVRPVGTGAEALAMDREQYYNLWSSIIDQHTSVKSDITAWIEGIYPSYESGDIPLENLMTSEQFTSSAAQEGGYTNSVADLAMLGVPLSEGVMSIELPESNATVKGSLSARNPPEGGFEVGTEYDPSNISGPVWLAYNYTTEDGEESSEVVELNETFRIVEATDSEGKQVDNVTFRSRNQRTLETDVDALNEELSQLMELQIELQEQQKQLAEAGNGGGGMLSEDSGFLTERLLGIPGWGWVVGGLGAVYAFSQQGR